MENDPSFNKDKAVGNSGENVVSFLIESMPDWKCIKFGVENMAYLKDIVRGVINSTTKKIKSMPDFVAFNTKTGKTYFVEVKYRNNPKHGGYLFRYLEEYNKYWAGTKLIVVRPNEPHFVYIDLEKITPNMRKSIEIEPGQWGSCWNFEDIQQDIKALFPELTEETIKTAVEMVK